MEEILEEEMVQPLAFNIDVAVEEAVQVELEALVLAVATTQVEMEVQDTVQI